MLKTYCMCKEYQSQILRTKFQCAIQFKGKDRSHKTTRSWSHRKVSLFDPNIPASKSTETLRHCSWVFPVLKHSEENYMLFVIHIFFVCLVFALWLLLQPIYIDEGLSWITALRMKQHASPTPENSLMIISGINMRKWKYMYVTTEPEWLMACRTLHPCGHTHTHTMTVAILYWLYKDLAECVQQIGCSVQGGVIKICVTLAAPRERGLHHGARFKMRIIRTDFRPRGKAGSSILEAH